MCSGKPRARRKPGQNAGTSIDTPDNPLPTPDDESFIAPLPASDSLQLPTVAKQPTTKRPLESPEIEALLMTQRARTPIAVSVAQDYPQTPFNLPRPFVVLGWFWIIDAWVCGIETL